MKTKISATFFISFFFLASCSPDPVNVTCDGTTISFVSQVKPIIDSRCATNSSCHGSGSHEGPGALTTYSAISQFKNQISSSVKSRSMPRGSTLTSDQISTIVCWIENGADNN